MRKSRFAEAQGGSQSARRLGAGWGNRWLLRDHANTTRLWTSMCAGVGDYGERLGPPKTA